MAICFRFVLQPLPDYLAMLVNINSIAVGVSQHKTCCSGSILICFRCQLNIVIFQFAAEFL